MNKLGKNIKTMRKDYGWSQQELADRVGYTNKSMIAKIENGKVDINQARLQKFADIFGCSIYDLQGLNTHSGDISYTARAVALHEKYRNDPNHNKKTEIYTIIKNIDDSDDLDLVLAFLKKITK